MVGVCLVIVLPFSRATILLWLMTQNMCGKKITHFRGVCPGQILLTFAVTRTSIEVVKIKGEEDPWTLVVFLVAYSFFNKVCDAAVVLGSAGPEASRLPQFILVLALQILAAISNATRIVMARVSGLGCCDVVQDFGCEIAANAAKVPRGPPRVCPPAVRPADDASTHRCLTFC